MGGGVSKQSKTLREKTAVPQGGQNSPVPATAAASAYPGPLTASLPCRVQMSQHHSQVSQHLQINQLISLSPCVCVFVGGSSKRTHRDGADRLTMTSSTTIQTFSTVYIRYPYAKLP